MQFCKKIGGAILLSLSCFLSFATHNRAGEIMVKHLTGNTYQITIITYTDTQSGIDRKELIVKWGDGKEDSISRVSKVSINNDINLNTYIGTHTYNGAKMYCITMEDPNRNEGINNIPNSVNVPFSLETCFDATMAVLFGNNNSPVLTNPPIGFANFGELYEYNPVAFDPDGDSLYYELTPCLGAGGLPVPGYTYPDDFGNNIPGTFNIDNLTGEISWNTPQELGEYNIAIKITEYRFGLFIGSVIRDMQIYVLDINNKPPVVEEINDTCIVAGDTLNIDVYASDPDSGQKVTLTAHGGPLEFVSNAAQFIADPPANSVSGSFSWPTGCNNVRSQFYEVVFRAEDDYQIAAFDKHLTGIETWLIYVIAPPPQNLGTTVTVNDDIKLTWDSIYNCSVNPNFEGFSIWRRVGSNPFTPDTCETGLKGRGYQRIAKNVKVYNYIDKNIHKGAKYCYRIYATFIDGAKSIPSNEACAELPRDVPVITNVSVEKTPDTTNFGNMYVAWSKPKAVDLDTIFNPPPYKYILYRSDDFSGTNPTAIDSFFSTSFAGLNDSTYIDSFITGNPNSYKIDFFTNGNDFIGETSVASSILLSIQPTDRQLNLSWQEIVPWWNEKYYVYRSDSFIGAFVLIDSTTSSSYKDKGLINGEDYCYYIQSYGTYGSSGILDPLINKSQINCGIPIDTIPPCPPELTVSNYCDLNPGDIWSNVKIENTLRWRNPENSCNDNDVVGYNIYYALNEDDNMSLIGSVNNPNDTVYVHSNLISLAGCYGITAFDVYNNESGMIKVCVDNCPFYELPNVFTPNGDYKNDFFTPIKPYRFVERIDMKIFNRWGQLVYKTDNPEILWDGKDIVSSNPVGEGVYFYICEVYTTRLKGTEVIKLPGGFVHLYR